MKQVINFGYKRHANLSRVLYISNFNLSLFLLNLISSLSYYKLTMRYLAIFLALAPSFALGDREFSWYKAQSCDEAQKVHTYTGTKSNAGVVHAQAVKFTFDKNKDSGYLNLEGEKNEREAESGLCVVLRKQGDQKFATAGWGWRT